MIRPIRPKKAKLSVSVPEASEAGSPPRFFIPTFIFLLIPVLVIFRSMRAHDYAHYAYWVQNDTLNALSFACFALAAVGAVIPQFRTLLASHLESFSRMPWTTRLIWLATAYLGFFAWCFFIRFCQFREFVLPQDSLLNVNSAYTFIHHGLLEYPHLGIKILSNHFVLMWVLFSPILLIWNSPIPLFLVQHVFVCSIPFAMYALVYEQTASAMAALAGLVLVSANPYLYELLTSNLNIVAAAACLPWAMFFVDRGRRFMLVLFLFLMFCNGEETPFVFFGLGLYFICRFRDRYPKNWLYGAAISVGSLLLWIVEIKIKQYYQAHEAIADFQGSPLAQWSYFLPMVPAGTPPTAVFHEILSHPLRSLGYLLSSPYKYYPVARLLWSTGLFAFLAPAYSFPFWTAALLHIMAAPTTPVHFFGNHPITYYDFGLHQASFVFGPLIWASAVGMGYAYVKLKNRRLQTWLLVWALAFAGAGFHQAQRTLLPQWRNHWFDAMPRVMAMIPANARIWVDEYASPPLGARRWIKIMQWGPMPPDGYHRLFAPDYALFDKAFISLAQPPYRDRMLTFFSKNGYVKIADDTNVILLKAPHPAPDPDADIQDWITLPDIDAKAASDYARYLVNGAPG